MQVEENWSRKMISICNRLIRSYSNKKRDYKNVNKINRNKKVVILNNQIKQMLRNLLKKL